MYAQLTSPVAKIFFSINSLFVQSIITTEEKGELKDMIIQNTPQIKTLLLQIPLFEDSTLVETQLLIFLGKIKPVTRNKSMNFDKKKVLELKRHKTSSNINKNEVKIYFYNLIFF